ncbi:MAG TPA: hypothetical protein VFE51_00230 [Verrucomicrobiae bacterium]|nr:hypothetical protein [Verrucomicrobiae bacterium]
MGGIMRPEPLEIENVTLLDTRTIRAMLAQHAKPSFPSGQGVVHLSSEVLAGLLQGGAA